MAAKSVRKELICYGRRTGQSAAALLDIRAERKKVREIPFGTYVYSVALCWLLCYRWDCFLEARMEEQEQVRRSPLAYVTLVGKPSAHPNASVHSRLAGNKIRTEAPVQAGRRLAFESEKCWHSSKKIVHTHPPVQ